MTDEAPLQETEAGLTPAAAGWFEPDRAARLPLTEVARAALRRLATKTEETTHY